VKNQIDTYIKKATTGLPSRERIDTAAELRVHLNAQVKKHLLEGHSKEEAEFLAVDAMGAPAPVNRQFLGHMLTPKFGWWLVALAVLMVSGWWGFTNREWLFNPPAKFSSIKFKPSQPSAYRSTTLELRPGEGVQAVRWVIFYRGEIIGGIHISQPKPRKLEPMTLSYDSSSSFVTQHCPQGGFLLNGVTHCTKNYSGCYEDMSFGYPFDKIPVNRWVPAYNQVSRAGAQAKNGTTEACILWVMFINPDLSISEPNPPLKFYPYADYFEFNSLRFDVPVVKD
jgi:hypothetical protein